MQEIYNKSDNKFFGSKRKRNPWYQRAHDMTHVYHTLFFEGNSPDYDRFYLRRDISKEIVWCARNYHEQVENRMIWLKGEDNEGEKYHFFIEYTERFKREYIREQIAKLNRAFRDLEIRDSMFFVTLTIDPSRYYSIYQSYKESQKNVNSLLTLLRQKLGHTFRYVKIAEIQEQNTKNIHYHLAISIKSDVYDWNTKDQDKIREIIKQYWKIGFSDIKFVKEKKKNGLKHYMMKYLLKSLNPKSGINENHAILWALNSRIFSFTNIKKWREANDLITGRKADKNNSNDIDDPEKFIVWEYQGVIDYMRIGIQPGLYPEKKMPGDVLEILYRMYYKNNDSG
ncbi:MAG: hypothetical protein QXV17_12585 [Candidatus Micrarchaeaceae archaeon]